ncbi:endonuclease [Psychroflexus montanilacus]|uniref:endonuclease n=1 Tax=Psychroflexus montanilacus TaxID=2873598 RepID=UPI001CCB3676|nr:endonuclease [Psychroflexus montanilacus]MBZ9650443.1 endonuclease [Psychroflexus montanilacus]
MNKITLLAFLFLGQIIFSQEVIINELYFRNPGVNDKQFIELKTDEPEVSLDGYVMVLFNGSNSGGNSSYDVLSLDGFVTDFNGLFVLGGPEMTPSPNVVIPTNFFQIGNDAVGIYEGSVDDFPDGTLATTTNLVDALVYGRNPDSDGQELPQLLDFQPGIIINTDQGKSIQRSVDNLNEWFIADPTPRQLNDGSGIVPVFIDVLPSTTLVNEGESFNVDFELSSPVTEPLTINFSLTSSTFGEENYSGSTSVTIAEGDVFGSTTITIIDDDIDDGDKFINLAVQSLGDPYFLNSNFIEIIVVDNDFSIADWGAPTDPTYEFVEPSGPENYFETLNGKSGQELREAIQDVIAEEGVVKIHTYADVIDILKAADQNPSNSNQVWLLYREQSSPKYLFQQGSSGTGFWNREHVFPRSRGDFFSIEEDEIPTGINEWWETNADSLRHANSDAHGLRATDANENSSRGNQHFGEYVGPSGTQGSFKGDVARALFYLSVRYNDLSVVDGFPDISGQLGDLQTLLQWHEEDPADDFEMNRNNVVYTWQNNRNPFIDYPELVDYVWGDKQGEVWNQSLSINQNEFQEVSIYPNPATGYIKFKGISPNTNVELYSMTGKKVLESKVQKETQLSLDLNAGVYLVRIINDSKAVTKKLIIK